MSLPTSEPIPFPEDELPPARRRRQKRLVLPDQKDERARYLDELGTRLTPGLEFFLSALLSGVIFGLALLLDSPALVLLAALLAPFMGPALGPSLAAVAGSFNYLFRSLGWLLAAGLIYFLSGTLAGIIARILPVSSVVQTAEMLHLNWTFLLLLTAGVCFTTYLLVRAPQQKPLVSSVAIAYSLMLPLGAAGYGLTAGIGAAWLNGLLMFTSNLIWCALCGMVVLFFLGLRPSNTRGAILATIYIAACIAAVLPATILASAKPARLAQEAQTAGMAETPSSPQIQAGESTLPSQPAQAAGAQDTDQPEPKIAVTPTSQVIPSATLKPSITPTSTPTHTLVPTNTPTITVTPQATAVWARINAKGGDGANIRKEPNYSSGVVIALLNGTIVEVLPDVVIETGVTWMKVRLDDGEEGWIVRSYLMTATPAPGW